jgi:predicted Ser/Thr protein kinase
MSQKGKLISITANYTSWLHTTSYQPQQDDPKKSEFCPYLNLSLSTRIGTDSRNAKVFLYKPPLCCGEYAIKVINPRPGYERFVQRELQISASLQPPFFPKVFASGSCKDNSYYIVMEKLTTEYKPTSSFVQEVIKAIHYLNYSKGILHNDLHKNNVMRRGLDPVIIDFGSAVQFKSGRDDFTDVTAFLISLGEEFVRLVDAVHNMDEYDLDKILRLTRKYIA